MRSRISALLLLVVTATPLLSPNVSAQFLETVKLANVGKLERITDHGDSLVGNLAGDTPDRLVSVYLPPSYAASPNSRYPVLYLLHGFTDSDDHWFGLSGQHFVASAAAWSPNPRNPPLYFDLPVKDGKVVQDVVARGDIAACARAMDEACIRQTV